MENDNHQNEVKMNYKGEYRQLWEVDGEVKEKDVGDVKGWSESKWENGKDANYIGHKEQQQRRPYFLSDTIVARKKK